MGKLIGLGAFPSDFGERAYPAAPTYYRPAAKAQRYGAWFRSPTTPKPIGRMTAIGQACEDCPPGQYGCGPEYCFDSPFAADVEDGAETPEETTATDACPPGTYGIPPACVPAPAGAQPPTTLPTTIPTAPPATTSPTAPAPAPAATTAPAPPKPSWWSQRSDTEKWVIVGGATLGAVGLFVLLKSAATPSYAKNPRRRRRSPKG